MAGGSGEKPWAEGDGLIGSRNLKSLPRQGGLAPANDPLGQVGTTVDLIACERHQLFSCDERVLLGSYQVEGSHKGRWGYVHGGTSRLCCLKCACGRARGKQGVLLCMFNEKNKQRARSCKTKLSFLAALDPVEGVD